MYIEALGICTIQPASCSPLTSTSRRFWYFSRFPDAILRAFEGGNRGNLDRRERAVIVITLDARQRGDQFLVAHHETYPPTGHVVALAHGEKFNRHIARPGDLHDGRRLPAVEADVGVRQIVHDLDSVLLRQATTRLEKRKFDALRGRIAGKAQDHHLRLRKLVLESRCSIPR